MSIPDGFEKVWELDTDFVTSTGMFNYHRDSSEGQGQTVYLIENSVVFSHPVCELLCA
jgi:hypothetical protein